MNIAQRKVVHRVLSSTSINLKEKKKHLLIFSYSQQELIKKMPS